MAFTISVRTSYKYSYIHFIEYLVENPIYSKYATVLPMDAIIPDIVMGFTNYLRKKCTGEGPRKNYYRFKKVVADTVEEGLMRKKPCKDIYIVYDTNVMLKEILLSKEICKLASFRYDGEHWKVQRAFIFCWYTGVRYCDVSELTFAISHFPHCRSVIGLCK